MFTEDAVTPPPSATLLQTGAQTLIGSWDKVWHDELGHLRRRPPAQQVAQGTAVQSAAARTIHQAHMVLDQLQRAQLGQGGGVLGRAGRGGPGGEEGYGLRDGGASVRECAHA